MVIFRFSDLSVKGYYSYGDIDPHEDTVQHISFEFLQSIYILLIPK